MNHCLLSTVSYCLRWFKISSFQVVAEKLLQLWSASSVFVSAEANCRELQFRKDFAFPRRTSSKSVAWIQSVGKEKSSRTRNGNNAVIIAKTSSLSKVGRDFEDLFRFVVVAARWKFELTHAFVYINITDDGEDFIRGNRIAIIRGSRYKWHRPAGICLRARERHGWEDIFFAEVGLECPQTVFFSDKYSE